MLKTKYALSALGLLVAMTMATDALAQGVFSVSSSIVPRARMPTVTPRLAGGDHVGSSGVTYGRGRWNCNDRLRRDDHECSRRRRRDEHHPSEHL